MSITNSIWGIILKSIFTVLMLSTGIRPVLCQQEDFVTLGENSWRLYNLEATVFNNGDSISFAKDYKTWLKYTKKGEPAFYFDEYDNANIYNRHVVLDSRGVFPDGWDLPSVDQFYDLEVFMANTAVYGDDFFHEADPTFWGYSTIEDSTLTGMWYSSDDYRFYRQKVKKTSGGAIRLIRKANIGDIINNVEEEEFPSPTKKFVDDIFTDLWYENYNLEDSISFMQSIGINDPNWVVVNFIEGIISPKISDVNVLPNNVLNVDSLRKQKQDIHSEPIATMTMNYAENVIATGAGRSIKLWRTTGSLIRTILAPEIINEVQFLKNDSVLIASCYYGKCYSWNVYTGELIASFEYEDYYKGTFQFMILSEDDEQFVFSITDRVFLLNTQDLTLKNTIQCDLGFYGGAFLTDTEILLVGAGLENSPSVWNTATKELVPYSDTQDETVDLFDVISGNGKVGALIYERREYDVETDKSLGKEDLFGFCNFDSGKLILGSKPGHNVSGCLLNSDGTKSLIRFYPHYECDTCVEGLEILRTDSIEVPSLHSIPLKSDIGMYQFSPSEAYVLVCHEGWLKIWDLENDLVTAEFEISLLENNYYRGGNFPYLGEVKGNKYESDYCIHNDKTVLSSMVTLQGYVDDVEDIRSNVFLQKYADRFIPSNGGFDSYRDIPLDELKFPEISSLINSNKSDFIVTVSEGGRVKQWNVRSGELMWDLGVFDFSDFFLSTSDSFLFQFRTDVKVLSMYDLSNKTKKWDLQISSDPRNIIVNEKTGLMLMNYPNTGLRWGIFDLNTGTLLYEYEESASDEAMWTLRSVEGYYMGPKNTTSSLQLNRGMERVNSDYFNLYYNRPDKVLEGMGIGSPELIKAYGLAFKKRLKKMGLTEVELSKNSYLPSIKIVNKNSIVSQTDADNLQLSLLVEDDSVKLMRINVWINNVPLYGEKGILINGGKVEELDIVVDLYKGLNEISVSVTNALGMESYREIIEVNSTFGKAKPDLYLISIGESKYKDSVFNLTYAAKDALDLAELFENSAYYENVHTKVLVDENVKKDSVLALKNFLVDADINDQVILFVAGHGVLDSKLDYYFATYDMNFVDPSDGGIAYEDLEGILEGIKPLKKVLLIDACHSGEIDKEEVALQLQNEETDEGIKFRSVGNMVQPKLGIQNTSELTKMLFSDLRRGTGATVISSAGGLEYAMESDEWNNGLFSYCVINGIVSGEADLDGNDEIWLSELKSYVYDQVFQLSKGRQQPTNRIENTVLDYRIW